MEINIYTGLHEDAVYIRKKVFQEEQGFVNEFDRVDDSAVHLVMMKGDVPVATCRIFQEDDVKKEKDKSRSNEHKEENEFILGRLAVLKEYRKEHLGSIMLAKASEYVAENGGTTIKLHSQCAARKFYESNGFSAYGEVEDDEGCPHIWMKKKVRR